MMCRPGHPLMWYAIYYTIITLLNAPDISTINAAKVLGPHAWHRAFQ
jgi:hypothetical protein